MDIEEGDRRLSMALFWYIWIFFWIPGAIALIFLFKYSGNLGELFVLSVFMIIVGFVIRDIFRRLVLWVIEGFSDDDKIAGSNND